MLLIAAPDTIDGRKMVDTAKLLKSDVQIVVRTHHEDKSKILKQDNIGKVLFGEEELAKGMSQYVFERYTPKSRLLAAF